MKISIGIVTFNNSQDQLKRLLESLSASYELAVSEHSIELSITGIDNGQSCFAAAIDKSAINKNIACHTVSTQGNIGFGRAMNALMRNSFSAPNSSSADIFIAVNPDGLFHRDCLFELVKSAQNYKNALLEARQFPEEHPKPYSIETGDTPWATGACLLIPKAIFETTGGFDENLFMYGEDVDLSWRAKAAGFDVKVVHNALFVHPTLGRVWSREAKKHFFLSAVYLAVKWQPNDFEQAYEEEFRSRFGQDDADLQLLARTKNAATAASSGIVNRTNFKPYFDKGRAFSESRWGY